MHASFMAWSSRLRKADYSLMLGNRTTRPAEQARYLTIFRSRPVDRLLMFLAAGDEERGRTMVKAKKPVVFVAPHTPNV